MSTLSPLPAEVLLSDQVPAKQKKTLVRRGAPDRSQQVRRAVQFAFLLLNAAIGVQFILWVRYFESGGTARYFERPAGVDGWLPIAGLMNLRYFLVTAADSTDSSIGDGSAVRVSAGKRAGEEGVLLVAVPGGDGLRVSVEAGAQGVQAEPGVPKWLDVPLRGLKYLLLAFFVYIVFTMSAMALGDFLASPFGIVADVKMLNFFRYMGTVGMMVVLVLVALSVVVAEFLVPLSLPVRRADGDCVGAEPGEDSARCGGLHRLREMQQGVPLAICRWTGWCRSGRWSARGAWSALRCARRRMRCRWR